jgi:hypothetical protein
MVLGYQVGLEFSITQHQRDLELMLLLPQFFRCGYVTVPYGLVSRSLTKDKTTCQYRIRKIMDLELNLFPLLEEFPLQTQKKPDAKAFREVHALIKAKQHLTAEGLQQIRQLKASMNRGRNNNLS